MTNFFDVPTSAFIEIKLRIDREMGQRTLSVAPPRDHRFWWQTVSWDGSGQMVLHPEAAHDFVEKVEALPTDIRFAHVGNRETFTWDADGEAIEHPATEVTFTRVGRKTKQHYLVFTRAELVVAAEQIADRLALTGGA